jgi:hypothetical protein
MRRRAVKKIALAEATATIDTALLDTLCPLAICEESRTALVIGDAYRRVFTITTYPSRFEFSGWLDTIFALSYVTVSINCYPTDRAALIKSINQQDSTARLLAANRAGSASERDEWQRTQDHCSELLRKMKDDNGTIFTTVISLVITASSLKSLEERSDFVRHMAKAQGLSPKSISCNQLEGFFMASPFCTSSKTALEQGGRPIPAETLASILPFSSAGIDDGRGVYVGQDNDGGLIRLATISLDRPCGRTNSNIVCLGGTGSGKSTLLKKIVSQEVVVERTKARVIDPEREYKDLCESLGGKWVNLGFGGISPFELRYGLPLDEEADLQGQMPLKPVTETIRFLRGLFSIAFNLTSEELSYLERALEQQYRRFGLSAEDDFEACRQLQDERSAQGEKLHPEPLDLYRGLEILARESGEGSTGEMYKSLAMKIRPVAKGAYKDLWAGLTTVNDDESDFIVFDTYDLDRAEDRIKSAQYYNILSWIWTRIQDARLKGDKRLVRLLLDEVHLIVNKNTPEAAAYLKQIAKRIRKYNGGLAVATQAAVDLLDERVRTDGQALIDGCAYKFIFSTDGANLAEVKGLFGLSEEITARLAQNLRGKCITFAGSQCAWTTVELRDKERQFIGTGGGQ